MKTRFSIMFAVVSIAAASFAIGCKDKTQSGKTGDQQKNEPAPQTPASPTPAPATNAPAANAPTGAAAVSVDKLKAFLPGEVDSFESDKTKSREVEKGEVSSVAWTYTTADPDNQYTIAIHFDGADKRTGQQRYEKAAARGGEKVTVGGYPALASVRLGLCQLTVYAGKCAVILTGGKESAQMLRDTAGKMNLAAIAKLPE